MCALAWLSVTLTLCVYHVQSDADILLGPDGTEYAYFIERTKINSFHPTYMGCDKPFANFPDPGLAHVMPAEVANITISNCIDYCKENFTFAGLQNGVTCRCGNLLLQETSANCRNAELQKCAGDPTEVCGGKHGATDVYAVCEPGMYPEPTSPFACRMRCPSQCSSGCYRNGLTCILDCKAGYNRDNRNLCIKGCPARMFGVGCHRENINCVDDIVHPFNGQCIIGCITGAKSIFCNEVYFTIANPEGPCPICEHCESTTCYGITVGSYYTCPTDWDAGLSCTGCTGETHWGAFCNRECSPGCVDQRCLQEDGTCVDGCLPGYYGQACAAECPINCYTRECDPMRGYCLECTSNTSGDMCENCVAGMTGTFCDQMCGRCAGGGGECRKENDTCVGGCLDGYFGALCDSACLWCAAAGGAGAGASVCRRQDGQCSPCVTGYYNASCGLACGGCVNGTACDQENGTCTEGCGSGFYGAKCDEACPVNCRESCNTSSGDCITCPLGFYDAQCNKVCPKNCNAAGCNASGRCLSGCVEGFSGINCNILLFDEDSQDEKSSIATGIAMALGIGTMIVVLTVIVVVIALLRYQTKKRDGGVRHMQVSTHDGKHVRETDTHRYNRLARSNRYSIPTIA